MASEAYFVGEWLVEPSLNRISKDAQVKKVEPQLMEVLHLLAMKSGEIVTKEELKNVIWSDVVVTENVFTRAISSLRKVLEDDPTNPSYIETISKTGYRLVAQTKRKSTQKSLDFFTLRLPRKPTLLVAGLILIVSFGAFVFLEALSPEPPPLQYEPNAIANSIATEYWPAISTDGRMIAFASNQDDGNWDIYAQPIGSESALRITAHSSAELRPVWSSDGSFIYYIRYEQGSANIYKKAVVGGNEVRVTQAPVLSKGDFDISTDGKWLLFNQRDEKNLPLNIVRISLETGGVEVLTSNKPGFNGDLNPRFSPNDEQIAFIREKNPASMFLYIKDLKSGEQTQLTTISQSINGFDWSKDGRHIIYGSNRSGLYKLWNVSTSSGKSTVMRAGDYQMVMPRVATTGRHIYAKMKDNVNIWQFDMEKQTASIWYGSNELNLNPTFSPNGEKVCFTMKKNGFYELWVADANGKNEVAITQFSGSYLTSPCWSENGESILFQGFADGQSDIFRVDAKGGIPVNLTSSTADEQTPVYGEDDVIYFSTNEAGEWQIAQLNLQTDVMEILLKGYAPKYLNGKIYFIKKEEAGIWEFDLTSRKETTIIEAFHPMHWGAFTVTEDGIYYLNAKNKRLEWFDFQTRESTVIYQPLKRIPRMGNSISISSNNRNLLFSQIDTHDADIMLLEEEVN